MKNVVDLQTEITKLRGKISVKDQRILQLEALLKEARHQRFAASSEKQSPDQQSLFDEAENDIEEDESSVQEIEVTPHTRKKKKRVSIPADIPREEKIYDLSDAEKFCPHDGTALKSMGEDTHEQLDIIPAQIKAIRHIRKKYACPCCEQYIVTAPKPKLPIEKGIASPGLLAYISVSKYCDALPLYRQVEIFKRIGIEMDRSSLSNWMIKCGELVQALIDRIQAHLLAQSILHMDETPVQVLNEPNKTAQSKSYMWVMNSVKSSSESAVLFHYSASRSGQIPVQILEGFSGALMVDGYPGYQRVCDEYDLQRLGCMVHARRKFIEAQRDQPKGKTGKADQALAFFQKLYAIESQAKGKTTQERYLIRQSQSKAVIDKLRKWLDKTLGHTPPKNKLGVAVQYLSNQWPRLMAYIEDGEYPIDNNRAENCIRPFVIGRKNWLFSSSQKGAVASANLYSLIETAKLNSIDPYVYLKKIFTDLPNAENQADVDALLPWNVGL
ncbi:MAG: IS66 family transposase [Sinobacterium sp.]|nr:IS66 family transposase [Sinobacterium sp.]